MQFIMVSDDAYTSVVFYITHIIWHETGENVSDKRKKEKKYRIRKKNYNASRTCSNLLIKCEIIYRKYKELF